MMSVSIVMPCYNEEGIIEHVVRSYYRAIIDKIGDSEFLVIDDCSKDKTYAILEHLKKELPRLVVLKNPVNSGHGRTVRFGYEQATKEWVFQVDSDNQFDSSDFWKLYALKDCYNFIVGARQKRHDPFFRLILTRCIQVAIFVVFGVWLADANCPFRLIKRTVLLGILPLIDRDALAPNIFFSIAAKRKGISSAFVAIPHYARTTGKGSLLRVKLIRFCWRGFLQMMRLRRRLFIPA